MICPECSTLMQSISKYSWMCLECFSIEIIAQCVDFNREVEYLTTCKLDEISSFELNDSSGSELTVSNPDRMMRSPPNCIYSVPSHTCQMNGTGHVDIDRQEVVNIVNSIFETNDEMVNIGNVVEAKLSNSI